MNLSIARKSLVNALIAHACGLLALVVLGFFGWKSRDPDRFSLWLGVISLVVGALICGVIARMSENGVVGALMSAGFYVIPVLIGSFFNIGGAELSMPVRIGIMSACAGLIIVIGMISGGASNGRRRKKRRASVRRSVERRFG